jgi:8-oxo-dGTP pyrophosphatase MutT (NUDIX family)
MKLPHATLPDWQNAGDEERLEKLRLMIEDLYRYQLAEHVQRVIEMLAQHPCADEKEAQDVRRIIEMARLHPNIFSPLCEVGHITGSALIVHPPTRRVLLNHHRKFDRWMQFGGHMDNDLAPHITALREAREESGLSDVWLLPSDLRGLKDPGGLGTAPRPFDVDIHVVPQRGDRPEHLHLDLRYLVTTDAPDAISTSDESLDVRWFRLDELDALNLEPGVWRMIRKAFPTII